LELILSVIVSFSCSSLAQSMNACVKAVCIHILQQSRIVVRRIDNTLCDMRPKECYQIFCIICRLATSKEHFILHRKHHSLHTFFKSFPGDTYSRLSVCELAALREHFPALALHPFFKSQVSQGPVNASKATE